MSDELTGREALRFFLMERYGNQVQPDDGYRPYFNTIQVGGYPEKRHRYVVVSRGEVFIQTSNWVRIGGISDPDVFELSNVELYQLYKLKEKKGHTL